MSKTRQTLGANLSRLMSSSAELASAPAVERATNLKGMKVGRSTVQRVKDAQTTVNLDYIEVFAKVFQKEPWQLLHPQLGESAPQSTSSPTLAQALEVVAGALYAADDLTIDQVRPLLSRLVDEPSRAVEIVPRLSALLSANPGAAMETAAFAGKPKSAVTPTQPVSAGEFVKR